MDEVRRRKPLNESTFFWLTILAILLLLVIYVWHRTLTRKPTKESAPIQVVSAVAQQKDVPIYLSALGLVTPTNSVTVRTMINGTLLNVYFKEGQQVKQGDLLAQIDPRPYEAQLTQYEGQLQRDQALYANALIDLKRYQTLWKQDSVAQQTLQTQQSLVTQYKGAIKVDQGLIQGVKVNLIYTKITAPVDGRVGLRLVDPGNFVQTSDTNGIVILNTLHPITVVFSIPEDNIADVMKKFTAAQGLEVKAFDRQQDELLATGKLLTVDNQIDRTTGTVKLKAQFANTEGLLFPNQFVNIKILVKTLSGATVIPTAAIQFSSSGASAYVLNADQTVRLVPIKVGQTQGQETVVLDGIKPGDQVVTEGTDKLVNGSKVKTQPSK